MADNGVAKAEDFKQTIEEQNSERVALPGSGLIARLRRPTPLWFLLHGQLPASLALRLETDRAADAKPAPSLQTVEELRGLADWMVKVLSYIFVEPKLSLTPAATEISPEWLDDEDVNFVLRWAYGEVTTEGRDLARFRRRASGPSSDARASGGDLALSPEPIAQTDSDGLPG